MVTQELLLVKLLRIIIDVLPEIELPPRTGRPYVYSPKVIICCLVVMVAKRITHRGLYSLLTSIDDYQSQAIREVIPFPDGKIPNRRTFDRRFVSSILPIQLYMILAILFLVRKGIIGTARLSLDNRMFEAVGGVWHGKDRKRGVVPDGLRNLDITAGWGISQYRGWVFGHALDVLVTTGKIVIPMIAVARSLQTRGNKAVVQLMRFLPLVGKGVISADSEYEDHKLAALVQLTGRSLHTPPRRHPDQVPNSKTYQRRKVTVEPYFERFLLAFVTRGKLDRKGPQAWPYLTACCFLYQLMVIYKVISHQPNLIQITHLIRML